jgi:hypothetical protein
MSSTARRVIFKAKARIEKPMAPARDVPRGGAGKRYAAKVERGASVYKKEWSHFMSGVDRSELEGVALKNDQDVSAGAGRATFAYLFDSSSKKKEKEAAAPKRGDAKRGKYAVEEPKVAEGPSRMEALTKTATRAGVELEGMNRKQRREAVRARMTDDEIAKADAPPPRPKPHELMDPKLAWYQQGPYPLDVVSEKLITKKAMKHQRQSGCKYNFELPHASWIAARARKRRDNNLESTGSRVVFAD